MMEAVKQSEQCGLETAANMQRAKVSNRRMLIMGVISITIFYIVWGIFKIVS